MIVIRIFQPEDFQWVIDIERTVFNEHDPYYYMQFYETCSEGFLVAEINSIVVGYIVGFRVSEETVRIFSFAVRSEYQNRGIGSALLKEVIDIFRQSGVVEVLLEVRQSNIKATRFYEKHGFRQIGTTEKYYNNGESAYLMRLKL